MSETAVNQSLPSADGSANARRALAVGDAPEVEAVREKLAAGGYEVLCATPGDAARAAAEFSPALALFAFGAREGEGEMVAVARRLRTAPETFALPLVFLFHTDERTLRSAALNVGADDYFALDVPRAETCARLDALFWRAEAGRRAAPTVSDQLSEIDNFLLLLDSASRDAQEAGARGTVALVGLAGEAERASEAEQGRALAAVHGFLKLNLRRLDAVAFYGPTILLVYLPRTDAKTAATTLSRMRAEFVAARPGSDFATGLVSFPSGDDKIEALVEKAEIALGDARSDVAQTRVVAYPEREGFKNTDAQHRPAHDAREVAGRAARTEGRTDDREAPARASGTGAREGERAARAGTGPRRLLLAVSDAERMAQVNLLMRSAGYEVRAAFDGQQALNLLRIERPDLVLVDHALNDMDGLEMLRRLRRQSGGKIGPAVVLMLPAGRVDLGEEAREAGARAVVDLPYDPVELLDVVRATGGAD